jgi:hypothetical protein
VGGAVGIDAVDPVERPLPVHHLALHQRRGEADEDQGGDGGPEADRTAGVVLDPPLASELDPLAEFGRSIRERYGVPDPDS